MDTQKRIDLDERMLSMPAAWRHRWCENKICGCLGGANCSGGLTRFGFTKEDWQEWCNDNMLEVPEGGSIGAFVITNEARYEVNISEPTIEYPNNNENSNSG